jgi:hypothetical protein
MRSVTETLSMQKLSYQHLRPGVLAFDAAHVVAAGFFIMNICHCVKLQQHKIELPACMLWLKQKDR